jgi:hypothetical protein
MRKAFVLIVSIILLCVSFPIAALEISVGAKGGVAHSGYMGEDHRADNQLSGYSNALFVRAIIGAFVNLGLSEHLQIQPEFLILGSGGKAADKADPANQYWAESLWYLSFPVLGKGVYSFINGDLFAVAGPAFQVLLGDGSDAGSTAGGTYSVDLSALNISAMAGIGYSLALFGGDVTFELRYIQSLSRNYDQDVFPDDHRTWSIALIAGYAFTLGR